MTFPRSDAPAAAWTRVFLQARMSSARFPGKMLAPLGGEPVISRVIRGATAALPAVPLVVVTSTEASDDPLASYVVSLGVTVFRGPLDDVAARFRLCLEKYPCDWIVRINGDSPLLDGTVVKAVFDTAMAGEADLVTTTFPRTFPRGQNVEMIRVAPFLAIDPREMTDDDREHVTAFYYRCPERFRIANVTSGRPELAASSLALDTLEDLRRLETLLADRVSLQERR